MKFVPGLRTVNEHASLVASGANHYNYFRDYDPTTGRYIQSDPIGLAGGLNTYSYAYSNPLIYTDPYRLAPPWVGPAAATLAATGGTLALYPNPATPPQVRVAGLVLTGIGGALQIWDVATAVDEIKEITTDDLNKIERNIKKINELLKPPPDQCD